MKLKWDNKYFKWGLTAFLVVAACLILYFIFKSSDGLAGILGTILGAFSSVILGFVFAYILNPLLKLIESPCKKLGLKINKSDEKKASGFARALGLVLTTVLVLAFLALLIWLIAPKVYDSILSIVSSLDDVYIKVMEYVNTNIDANTEVGNFIISTINNISAGISSLFETGILGQVAGYIETAISGVVGVVSGVFDVILGLIIAIYILADKERLAAQGKKLCYSFLKTEKATSFIKALKKIDKIFTGFISARLLDSIIIAVICYAVMWIFDMPYKELISVIIGVTNIIPVFGPFIGAIPSALLILFVSPVKCLIFVIAIVVIQQIDGNVICPKIVGNKTGLSGFWVLCSMLVFGGLFGFVGMLIGVPLFACIFAFIKNEIYERLDKKNITNNTEEFEKISYIDPETNEPVAYVPEKREENPKKKARKKKKK